MTNAERAALVEAAASSIRNMLDDTDYADMEHPIVAHLRSLAAELRAEPDHASLLAQIGDVLNQELRENGPADVQQVNSITDDMRPLIRLLVDNLRRKYVPDASEERS